MDETTGRSAEIQLFPKPNNDGSTVEDLGVLLERVCKVCEESGDGLSNFRARITELEERLAEERFHLAVLGQFKRGKSTLLNAFLGRPLLGAGILPLTAVPTFLGLAATPRLKLSYLSGNTEEREAADLASLSDWPAERNRWAPKRSASRLEAGISSARF